MATPAFPPPTEGPSPPRSAGSLGPDVTAEQLFAQLAGLGPFRIIHQAGASTFEAIVRVAPATRVGPFLNIICDEYHWHLRLAGVGHVRSFDQTHARSGRRVLFLALADRDPARGGEVFTRLYVHRAKGAEFEPAVLEGFLHLHAALDRGAALAIPAARAEVEKS